MCTENRVCPSCGCEFVAEVGGRGRPRVYCSDGCSDLDKYFRAFSAALEGVTLTAGKATEWRGELFALRNLAIRQGRAAA